MHAMQLRSIDIELPNSKNIGENANFQNVLPRPPPLLLLPPPMLPTLNKQHDTSSSPSSISRTKQTQH